MEMLGLLPRDADYVSFCVVRNPYDRALSSVIHFTKAEWTNSENDEERRVGFELDLESWLNRPIEDHNMRAHRRAQIDFVRNRKGEVVVNHILRFETLAEDFLALGEHLGWTGINIKRVGDSGRRKSYQDFYSERSKKMVEECFGDDCEAFGFNY